ncbi:MAG: substrate-binding domain-containing protein [Planctomycetes bacterium]|nr:substrate-binding domain-containing protein [Planctomycetota bacterium]
MDFKSRSPIHPPPAIRPAGRGFEHEMSGRRFRFHALALAAATIGLAGCTSPPTGPPARLRYAGSSTVSVFLRDAEEAYGRVVFEMVTAGESQGGEAAIVAGTTDLAGIADRPQPATLRAGVASTLIGRDAIAIIVNPQNRVTSLSADALRSIFTGKARNWNEFGGPDLPILPYIVGPGSATRKVFRETVLHDEDYAGCREIQQDRDIIKAVQDTVGGVGQISFSFLGETQAVRPIWVDGEEPSVANFRYPISRPLYLLWRDGNAAVEAFVEWTQTAEGQRVVMKRFVGLRVVGSVRAGHEETPTGTLVVYTETYPVYDGGVYYYPHRPFDLLTRHGAPIRRVQNHRGDNDEKPTPVKLLPGTYLIRPETSRKTISEYFVTIESGKTTEVNVDSLQQEEQK